MAWFFLSLSVSCAAHRSPHLTQRWLVKCSGVGTTRKRFASLRMIPVELSNGTKQQKYTILHRTRMSWLINKYYLGVLCLEMTENGDDHVFTPMNHDFVLSDGRIVRPTDTPEALGLREGDVIRVMLS